MTGDWTFFSNYGHVLVCLARNRDARLRDVAQEVGITERAVQKIVRDLQDGGYVEVSKQGRCNRYRINRRKSLRHPLQSQCTVGKLLALVTAGESAGSSDAEVGVPDFPATASPPPAPSTEAKREAKPEAEPESEPASPPKRDGESKKDGGKKPPPTDTREQGSLF